MAETQSTLIDIYVALRFALAKNNLEDLKKEIAFQAEELRKLIKER